MILIDTSSWIEFLRDYDSEPAGRVEALISNGKAAWCDLVALELWNGVRAGPETKALKALETELVCVEMNVTAWQLARRLAATVRKRGFTVPSSDIAIVACARAHGLAIEHHDKHFDIVLPIAEKL